MSETVEVGVLGATGRMGKALIEAVLDDAACGLAGIFVRENHPLIDEKLIVKGHSLSYVSAIPTETKIDVIVDFTIPDNSINYLDACVKNRIGMVIGTTGFSSAEEARLEQASKHIPIVYASNMSVGVNVTYALLRLAAKMLGESSDIEITEAHHRHKKDSPSGTALSMAKEIAQTLEWQPDSAFNLTRTLDQHPREPNQIGFSVIRAGDIVGEHTVMFAGKHERVEISHKAHSRSVFAEGAVVAAKFLANKTQGLYSMADVLGIPSYSTLRVIDENG